MRAFRAEVRRTRIGDRNLLTQIFTHKRQILKSASIISIITFVSRISRICSGSAFDAVVRHHWNCRLVRIWRIGFRITSAAGRGRVDDCRLHSCIHRLHAESNAGRDLGVCEPTVLDIFRRDGRLDGLGVIFFAAGGSVIFDVREERVQVEAIYLNRLMFPYILFIGMSALAMAILNCFHVFGLPAATPILLNISFIVFSVAIVWRHFSSPAVALAVGVLVGGIFQFFLAELSQIVRRGMDFQFKVSFSDPGRSSGSSNNGVRALSGSG